ncbi:peroxisomal adenine nucleotide transporter 1 [Magnaporthiopsis poae ATCC 64411]|uniref:Peroxisomal adenine nucleotide transporter 1 n=1 Tax=Magnaporthiopsis poae (strain ATCC 64411 / 73-15) TaxID=644358 RepID=A0A0C4DRP4_MAGP6|nr:peroxisomal adenine nucleotide transporter 1 [Magnaporthiopsis poae ATCC 64411]
MAAQAKSAPIGPWGRATAGAAGAVLANALVYPLDIVKTRLQVQSKPKPGEALLTDAANQHYTSTWDAITKIVDQDGLEGLYAGMSGALLGVASTNFAYFYWYSVVRALYQRSAGSTPPSTAVGATQSKEERKGLIATAREVVASEDGVFGLWRGLKASLVLVVNPAITYGAYERLKVVFFPGKTNLKPWEAFVLGAMSKSLATLATQPLIVAKVGLQSKPPPVRNGKPFKSFVEVMRFIVDNEGLLGLFKGIGPQLLKGLLVQGFLMMTKERVELMFILFLRYMRGLRSAQLAKAKELAATASTAAASKVSPIVVK